jgi:ribose transport system permease protein
MSQNFFTSRNIINLLQQNADMVLLALGELGVILTGGIDLSIGSLIALSGVMFAEMLQNDIPLPMCFVYVILAFLVVGVIEGYLVAKLKMAPFVVTLAFMSIARGFAFVLSSGGAVQVTNQHVLNFGTERFAGIPLPVLLAIIFFLILAYIYKFTAFGRYIKAIGSNEKAVRLSGIRVSIYKMSVYIISAVMCVFGGFIIVARSGVGSPVTGDGFELNAIAACVIGGASLAGGKGTPLNTIIGVLILGLLGNVMNLMNIASYPQQIAMGIIILIAVFFQGINDSERRTD